jgi:cytochrome c553
MVRAALGRRASTMTPFPYSAASVVAGSLWLLAIPSVSSAADGRALAMNGNGKGALPCAACHGAQGEGQPSAGFPRLDGLSGVYIRQQLDDFADGKRTNDIMRPIASALSPDERQAVATFYAGQTAAKAAEAAKADEATISRGAALAAHGDWSKGLPGCNQCHGPDGEGVAGTFPKLAAQNAKYLAGQLKDWQLGKRANDPLHLMTTISAKLDDGEIAAVAAYYASLPTAPASQQGTAR